MITKSQAIFSLVTDCEFSITGDGIDGIVEWIKPKIAPVSEDDIRSEYNRLVKDEFMKISRKNREQAYRVEADPLFFKFQRGEKTQAEWIAKVDEIRQRFPY